MDDACVVVAVLEIVEVVSDVDMIFAGRCSCYANTSSVFNTECYTELI